MNTLPEHLTSLFIRVTAPLLSKEKDNIADLKQVTQDKFGHYQYNSAMRFAKLLGKPPREIASYIAAEVEKLKDPLILSLEIAGPGFINITLNPNEIARIIEQECKKEKAFLPNIQKKQVAIDFSSPNTAKEMHVGHLRSTIIGDSLARILEHLGHDVLRINHIGDWGTAFGMLIAYLKEIEPGVISGDTQTKLSSLVNWYREAKKKFDEDIDFKKRAQLQVVALQNGEENALKAWKIICEISSKAYQEIYDLLDIHLTERGESFYNPLLSGVVEGLTDKGLVEEDDGAKCIFLDGFLGREGEPLPLIIQKSDGGFNYATTDLAAISHRLMQEKRDWLIYVTDSGQAQHFKMIFQVAEKANYFDINKVRVNHVPFGLVLGPDGKKYKTRSGETEKLIDLINEAIKRAAIIIREKNPDFLDDEVNKMAKVLGIGAIKYADLSTNRVGDYVFSYDKMLRFEGNTAAYLLYSYVRIISIKKKIGPSARNTRIILEHPSEIALGVLLLQFSDSLKKAAEELMPNRLTDYLYHLANKFHAFYRDCHIKGSDREQERLLLSEIVASTMKKGLSLLGVKTVDKM